MIRDNLANDKGEEMNYVLNLREVTYALSEALDYVGIDDTMHGKRVAFMAAEIGKRLGWPAERINDLIVAGMMHDCGVSSTDVHDHLVSELDWDNSQAHCIRGSALLEKVGIYRDYAQAIFYHHTHWDEMPPTLDAVTMENANLIYLVDRVDALRVQIGDADAHQRAQIGDMIRKYAGKMFSPELVDAYTFCAQADSFWFYLESEALSGYLHEWLEKGSSEEVPFESIKAVAMMFADVVDAKSTFTTEHSYGVASLGRYIARGLELGREIEERVELAALLHDLGKLRVADAILNKQGPLNEDERLKMNRHGFDSHMILRKIKGMHDIARIASLHHEYLNASGYPYHLTAAEIPLEARVLAVADIFQALIQDRPYRRGLYAEGALEILRQMVGDGRLDPRIVAFVETDLQQCYEHAKKGIEL